jgi:hypothetical protein
LLHELAKIHTSFDDPNLVSRAGLVPVMALAQRAGLAALAGEQVAIAGRCGVNPHLKVPCLVGGMIGGQHRGHGPAAARGNAGAVWWDPGPVHAGLVPALVQLGERAPAAEGAPGVPG